MSSPNLLSSFPQMAIIFKKLLTSDSTANKKTSSSSSSSPSPSPSAVSAFPRSHSFNVQPQQQQRQKTNVANGRQRANGDTPNGQQKTTQRKNGPCSSTAPSSSAATTTEYSVSEEEGRLLDGIDDLCKSLYKRTLRKEKIRLTVFSEKDRRLLYDSETVVAVGDRLVIGSQRSPCGRFQFLPHKDDKWDIAKMLFGTLPSAMKTDSLKIHTLGDSNCVMVSRVFSVPRLNKYYINATANPFKSNDIYKCTVGSLSSDSDNQSNYSTIRSLEGIQDRTREVDLVPLNLHLQQQHHPSHHSCARFPLSFSRTSATGSEPPERFYRARNSSLQLESNDEDIMEMEELRAFSPNRLSRIRRRQLSQLGLDDAVSLRLSNRSRLSSCSSIADACDSSAEWKQYGFALLLPCDFRSFVFQHILQIERELDRLVLQIHKAVQDKTHFFQLLYEGWASLCASLCLLCNSPRLRSPVWLSFVSADLDKGHIATEFCSNLACLIRLLNTKETKFLFSTAISAVLMNQLAWIASVAPPDKCSADTFRPLLFGTSSIDPRQMPYNPAVAQWLELHSGIGIASDECKFVKVVVVGQNRRLIATMLNVLSYFVRCSSVESRREKIMTDSFPSISDENQPLYDFGRSLFAGICRTYSPHFVLSGFDTTKIALDDLLSAIYEDVRHPMGEPCANSQMLLSLSPSASQMLSSVAAGIALDIDNSPPPTMVHEETAHSVDLSSPNQRGSNCAAFPAPHRHHHHQQSFGSHSAANSSAAKSLLKHQQQQEDDKRSTVVVLIDIQNFVVKLIMAENCVVDEMKFDGPSEAVAAMFEEFAELFSHHCVSEFLLSFLEDRLGSLLSKSNVLVNLLTSADGQCSTLPMEHVSAVLDCDCSDLLLIRNIAAVYSPGILTSSN